MANAITPSTFAGGLTQGAALYLSAVTSSGSYFQVGDASKVVVVVTNGSSTANGAIYVVPGAAWSGARGQAASTDVTTYSTGTAPIVMAVNANAITGSTATMSTTGWLAVLGPFESAQVKSSDGRIFIAASTVSTKMCAAVYALEGGSS